MNPPDADDTCAAFGCCEQRQSASAEFCKNHERQLHEFRRWLAGVDEAGCPVARAFDAERGMWSARRRTA
jgi:hypothetical protein